MNRCPWPADDALMIRYHDEEWGVPVHDDIKHFEFLILEGAQAGLSWRTVLHRREGYRAAFAQFDPARVARFDKRRVERLLQDPGIIRNRAKVESAIKNAKAFLKVQEEFGTFDRYFWDFVDGRPVDGRRKTLKALPPTTPLSDKVSKDLKRRDFSFVGSTVIYAHLQAAGLVNDHLVTCFRYQDLMGES